MSFTGSFTQRLSADLPGSLPAEEFVRRTAESLRRLGFDERTALPLVGVCRDELTAPFTVAVRVRWGNPFLLGSLGGLVGLGRTGLTAAAGHAPVVDGPPRFVAYLLPHLGIDADGEVGWTQRRGQRERSTACGALVALRAQMLAGVRCEDAVDPDDVELSLLRMRLCQTLRAGLGPGSEPTVPDLLGLTDLMHGAIVEDFLRAADGVEAMRTASIAVLSGILVHGPGGADWVAPRAAFVRAPDGQREQVSL